jgi:hypothetical protein
MEIHRQTGLQSTDGESTLYLEVPTSRMETLHSRLLCFPLILEANFLFTPTFLMELGLQFFSRNSLFLAISAAQTFIRKYCQVHLIVSFSGKIKSIVILRVYASCKLAFLPIT